MPPMMFGWRRIMRGEIANEPPSPPRCVPAPPLPLTARRSTSPHLRSALVAQDPSHLHHPRCLPRRLRKGRSDLKAGFGISSRHLDARDHEIPLMLRLHHPYPILHDPPSPAVIITPRPADCRRSGPNAFTSPPLPPLEKPLPPLPLASRTFASNCQSERSDRS
jgi:hypothetical protein